MKRFIPILLFLFGLILLGTFGFVTIEGWSFFDALYMSVITLTTVGYKEVHDLSHEGRVFNLFLILLGVGGVTYAISKIVSEIMNIDFEERRRKRMQKRIDRLKNHTIVCGYGRMGEVICKELAHHHINFVVIEQREALVHELKKTPYFFIEGDAANDDNLISAGIERANVLVSAVNNDSDGLYIALAGRSLNPSLFIIVRANEQKAKAQILRAGANKVILPFIMSGHKVAESVINPAVEDLFDLTGAQKDDENKIQLADLFITETCSMRNASLADLGPQMQDLIIVGVRNKEEGFLFKPESSYQFKEGDCLITMGPRRSYKKAIEQLNFATQAQ